MKDPVEDGLLLLSVCMSFVLLLVSLVSFAVVVVVVVVVVMLLMLLLLSVSFDDEFALAWKLTLRRGGNCTFSSSIFDIIVFDVSDVSDVSDAFNVS